jgi:RimJ/RimL family protein N-acetyltransferase
VRADTAPDNVASRRTLERAGFVRVVADADLLRYEFSVG